ncbi:putative ATPase [Bradyrhizobium sp. USDA 4463]
MKIDRLLISNFRGISLVDATDLGDTIIIAGQNGSGKSCIFDAIRLMKTTYGGYAQNEWQHFLGEFAIQLHGGAAHLAGLFNDPAKPVEIAADFRLRDNEKAYISANVASLLEETIWQTLLPEAFQFGGYRKALFAAQFRERQPEVTKRVQEETVTLLEELAAPTVTAAIKIEPNGDVFTAPSRLLAVVFTMYRPREIGVIDFHGAQRHYGRENVQGINLSLEQANQAQQQHQLYNYNNKYANVKSEMAGNFVKELLAEKAAPNSQLAGNGLSNTLKELFESFFPDKKFLGPQPTAKGSLAFPVLTPSGRDHDLDELSSGEKEILYGYLRIRSSAPRDSIILLDEPELHLNPRLIRGLPEFYRRHLGEALQNQLWLVTHSDALIREAVGKPGFNVYHMLPCGTEPAGASQLRPLKASGDLELVLTDLVGDLAAYRPGGKGLIFEGGGDSEFDKKFVAALFPAELKGINLISGTNKSRVRALHEILESAHARGDLPTKFYAVVDRDYEGPADPKAVNRHVWDVYHIENYLLDRKFLVEVLKSLGLDKYTEQNIFDHVGAAARDVVPAMLIQKMRQYANSSLVGAIDLGFAPDTLTIARDLHGSAARSVARVNAALTERLSEEKLQAEEQKYRTEIEQSFADGTWSTKLPGRDILKRFVGAEKLPVGYEVFRNLVMSKMAERGHKPAGMKKVIDAIVAD